MDLLNSRQSTGRHSVSEYFGSALLRSATLVIDPYRALGIGAVLKPEQLNGVVVVHLELRRFGQFNTDKWAEMLQDFGLVYSTAGDIFRSVVAVGDGDGDVAAGSAVGDLTVRLMAIGEDPMRNESLMFALAGLTKPKYSLDGRTPFAGLGKRIGLRHRHRVTWRTRVRLSLNRTQRWAYIEGALFEVAGLIVRYFGVDGLTKKRLVAMRQLTEVGGVPALTEGRQLEALVENPWRRASGGDAGWRGGCAGAGRRGGTRGERGERGQGLGTSSPDRE